MAKTDVIYHELISDILTNGIVKKDRTGTGTISTFGKTIKFDMRNGFPLLTTKKLHIRSIIHELLWFLKGDTNIKYLNDNNVTIWDEWADEYGDLGPVYGKQWVDWGGYINKWQEKYSMGGSFGGATQIVYGEWKENYVRGINQIQNLVDRLKTNPDCRRLIVNAWNVAELNKMALMPCHYGFQVWTCEIPTKDRVLLADFTSEKKENLINYLEHSSEHKADEIITKDLDELNVPKRYISLLWIQRSVDSGLGLPFNIASYGLLLHMLGQQVGMVPFELVGQLGDTHVYLNHIDTLKEQLERDTMQYDAPTLRLKKAESIFHYQYEDFEFVDYHSYPKLDMPISIQKPFTRLFLLLL